MCKIWLMTLNIGFSGTTTGTPKATKKVRGEGGGREIQKDLSARLYSKYGLLGGDRYTPATISKSLKLKPYGIPVDANSTYVTIVL